MQYDPYFMDRILSNVPSRARLLNSFNPTQQSQQPISDSYTPMYQGNSDAVANEIVNYESPQTFGNMMDETLNSKTKSNQPLFSYGKNYVIHKLPSASEMMADSVAHREMQKWKTGEDKFVPNNDPSSYGNGYDIKEGAIPHIADNYSRSNPQNDLPVMTKQTREYLLQIGQIHETEPVLVPYLDEKGNMDLHLFGEKPTKNKTIE
jgi:hypothetical protein